MVAWYCRSSGKERGVNGLAQMLNAAMYIGYSGSGDDGRAELERNAPVIVYLLAKIARKHLLIAPVIEARALAASPLQPDGQGEAPPGTRWEPGRCFQRDFYYWLTLPRAEGGAGLIQSTADLSAFYYRTEHDEFLLGVYVDEMMT